LDFNKGAGAPFVFGSNQNEAKMMEKIFRFEAKKNLFFASFAPKRNTGNLKRHENEPSEMKKQTKIHKAKIVLS
jgi:hypothetical protein